MEQHANGVVWSNMCTGNENGLDIGVILNGEKDEQLNVK